MRERVIDVWVAALGDVAGQLERALAADERQRAERFAPGAPRRRFVARRALRRAVLARYAGCPPDRLRFTRTSAGEPALAGAGDLRFSCSSSGDLALVAVARGRRVGVDVERLRAVSDPLAIAGSLFAADECAALRALPEGARDAAFLRGWTRKEARAKATGQGLAIGLDTIRVSLEPGGELEPLGDGWAVRALRPAPDHVGAVAAEGSDWEVRRRWW